MFCQNDTLMHHPFSIKGMAVGDKFFGCSCCGYQTETGIAACVLECPVCLSRLTDYHVTEDDLKQLTMEQLTRRMGSLADGQPSHHVIGAALNIVASCIKATDDRQVLSAVGLTLLEMLEFLKTHMQEQDEKPKIQLQ